MKDVLSALAKWYTAVLVCGLGTRSGIDIMTVIFGNDWSFHLALY